jgi:hypothetical protein
MSLARLFNSQEHLWSNISLCGGKGLKWSSLFQALQNNWTLWEEDKKGEGGEERKRWQDEVWDEIKGRKSS